MKKSKQQVSQSRREFLRNAGATGGAAAIAASAPGIAMAETTAATSCPASTSALMRPATFLIRAMSPTDVPPNFITMRDMQVPPASATIPTQQSAKRCC